MLRIAGAKPAPPQDPAATPPAVDVKPLLADDSGAEPDAPIDDPSSGKFDAEKVSPIMVHYMTPDLGPFECQRCTHWEAPNACIVVSGKIEPAGCCNLFEPADTDMDPEADENGAGAPEGGDLGAEPQDPVS